MVVERPVVALGRGPGLAGLALAALVLAVPAPAQTDCSVAGQNAFVRDTLQRHYLWYDRLPEIDPSAYESPEALLDAVRYRPLDSSFSYITGKAASDAFYSDSQFIGIGFGARVTPEGEYRVSQVFPDSPASDVGLARGDRFVAVAGRPIEDLLSSGGLGAALGPEEVGYAVDLVWSDRGGVERSGTVVKRFVTIPTVSQLGVLELSGRRVGYLHFRNFVRPSYAALGSAFTFLQRMGVEDLVLDLRYNGGGLLDVAQHLSSLIGGLLTANEVFVEFSHNDQNRAWDQTVYFAANELAIDGPRLVVITTRATASASEVVINSLRPFLPVGVVGEATYGKPVGQYGFDFCEKVLFPVAFQLRNAAGQGDYFGGFPPDCAAADDLEHDLADPAEASFAEALHLLERGACSPVSEGAAAAQSRRTLPTDAPVGWRALLNAW